MLSPTANSIQENKVAGTRTAGTVDGTPAFTGITVHIVDASGDFSTDYILAPGVPDAAAIESYVAAYQAATQASVYKVTVSQIYEGAVDVANAQNAQRSSCADGVNILWRNNATQSTQNQRVMAPDPTTMSNDTDSPITGTGPIAALLTAAGTLLTDYNAASAQYTERRERRNNPKLRL